MVTAGFLFTTPREKRGRGQQHREGSASQCSSSRLTLLASQVAVLVVVAFVIMIAAAAVVVTAAAAALTRVFKGVCDLNGLFTARRGMLLVALLVAVTMLMAVAMVVVVVLSIACNHRAQHLTFALGFFAQLKF